MAQQKYTINGYVTEAASGEELLGASVYTADFAYGASTNTYGYYSITMPEGEYTIVYQYVGYRDTTININLNKDILLKVELHSSSQKLDVVEVTAERNTQNVESIEMSTIKLDIESIKSIPAIFGEIDIIKSLQLLPGITGAGEGIGGFFVRGGGADQNLILLDEAIVYNAFHLLGFFSVFNPDAIKDMKVYKGGIPAKYGGRLSSLIDIRMKEGNSKKFSMSGGIGTISSRLTIEAPIVKDKISFIASGRRTYVDLFLKASPDEEVNQNVMYFYDMSAKINWRINDKNRLFLSGYFGRDILKFGDEFKTDWGNITSTVRYNHLFSKKLFANYTFSYSKFNYSLGVPEGAFSFDWDAYIEDFSLKNDYTYYINPKNTLEFGWVVTHHNFGPGAFEPDDEDESIFNSFILPEKNAIETGLYVSNEQKLGNKVTVQYGLRYSGFYNIGPGQVYKYDEDFETVIDTIYYDAFKGIKFYHGLEPRFSINYKINQKNSIKASYNRTRQPMHLISNATISSPFDIWVPSDPYIHPQIADQVAVGYFRNFFQNMLETSIEVYYKKMNHLVDYIDNAELLLNDKLETQLLSGKGWSFGAELLVRKQVGDFTGWVSYTIARTRRQVPGINNGEVYPATNDRTHDLSIVGTYNINKHWVIGFNWVYTTGLAVTFPAGRFEYAGVSAPVFTSRNGYRIPPYHRMDFSATYSWRRNGTSKWEHQLNFSVYNLYYRKNTFSIKFEDDGSGETKAIKTYLFPVIPSITYNFKF